jgi:hypothetical protein
MFCFICRRKDSYSTVQYSTVVYSICTVGGNLSFTVNICEQNCLCFLTVLYSTYTSVAGYREVCDIQREQRGV